MLTVIFKMPKERGKKSIPDVKLADKGQVLALLKKLGAKKIRFKLQG